MEDKITYWGIGVCHLCGQENNSIAKEDWYLCSRCGTQFRSLVNPLFYSKVAESKDEFNSRICSPVRIAEVNEIIKRLGDTEGKSIIDIGCGMGWISELLYRQGGFGRVCCTDLPNRDIQIENNNIEIFYDDSETNGIPDKYKGQFDYCLVYDVIEHVKYPRKWFNTLRPLLKENGVIFGSYIVPRESLPLSEWRFSTKEGISNIVDGFQVISIDNGRFHLKV